MGAINSRETLLAHETAGTGAPVVLLHGLTFDRTTWRPVVDELGGTLRTIAIDLPAHGGSAGPPLPVDRLAARVHGVLVDLGVPRPVVVGHSFGAAVALMYAATYPSLGVVTVDSGPEQQPFAEFAQRAAPVLRGPGFGEAWAPFEASLGLDLIPQPAQTLVRAAHRVDREVVLGYWEQLLTTPPPEFQASIDAFVARIRVPVLAVYGRPASPGDRKRFAALPDARIEEYPGEGHFVHLVDPARFAGSLRRFAARCTAAAPAGGAMDGPRGPDR